ncbi:hypothetical protein ANN_02769 [Periplaneta americana]|uniref:Transposase n=1 Tax=Periplaneta americana TaxID=6978 RepID=A0ABQ8TZN9_PERAM|nr:hypothetical protein ANN_02769 [Periplaneta americana]
MRQPSQEITRGDAFLEPYMQGLAPPDFSSSHHHLHHAVQVSSTTTAATESKSHTTTPEDGSVTSSPAGDVCDGPTNHNTLADLSAQFRLLELDGSADSLDQVRFSLNMWAGIIGDRLVGPHVLVNRLTGQAYTNFLENTIPHVLEDTPLINRQHIHFLHDGAPAHFSRTARRYLDRRFPDRWIGRGGPIAWPPRSPDLNPLDFYLWGHLKSLVYSFPCLIWNPFGIELWNVLRTYAILLQFGIVFTGQ